MGFSVCTGLSLGKGDGSSVGYLLAAGKFVKPTSVGVELVEGLLVDAVGKFVLIDGLNVGRVEGSVDGFKVGVTVVGRADGKHDGFSEGFNVDGFNVGTLDGYNEGTRDG